VFVVGCLGDWSRAAQVLFERESVQRNSAKSGTAREEIAGTLAARSGECRNNPEQLVAGTLGRAIAKSRTELDNHGAYIPMAIQAGAIRENPASGPDGVGVRTDGVAYTIEARAEVQAVGQPVPYDLFQITAPVNRQNRKPGDPCHTLARDNAAHAAVAIGLTTYETPKFAHEVQPTLTVPSPSGGGQPPAVAHAMTVRRLTPVECERLQGFPDNWTAIPWRKKTAEECPDGPRYKALGNSMACNCMAWIGEQIAKWEADHA
jgi:DNA (cytosine-5)-methyltransferase 1